MESKSLTKKTNRTPSDLYQKSGALIITALVVLSGAVLAISFLLPKGERVKTDGYQVVYMASGQAYFGKLKNTSGEYLLLETPFTAQDVKAEGDNAPSSTTLLKVSQQQYGPEDAMSLKSDQVLFWQNLRDDSKVTEAINNAK